MKQFGLSLVWDNNSGFTNWLDSGPRAVAYAEAAADATSNAIFGGFTSNSYAQAIVILASSKEVLIADTLENAEAAELGWFSNRFYLASQGIAEAVDSNTAGLWCAQQFCQTGGVETVGPITIIPTASGTLDSVSTSDTASAKWFVTIYDDVTDETKVVEVTAAFTSGMPSFTQHAIVGDKINTNINVIYSGLDATVIVTNNGANSVTVRAARILTEV